METPIKVSTLKARLTVKELISGEMARSMMVNGSTDRRLATVSGKAFMVTPILDNGKTQRLRAMVCTHGSMETDMKVSGKHV